MIEQRQRLLSGAPWERKVGYCRAVRHGSQIAVAGTTALGDDGEIVGRDDPYRQTQRCLEIIAKALQDCSADLSDVVRTRLFVTQIADWEEIGRAHAEVFRNHPPASTMVEVSRLINPEMRVEIEVDAILADD